MNRRDLPGLVPEDEAPEEGEELLDLPGDPPRDHDWHLELYLDWLEVQMDACGLLGVAEGPEGEE